MKLKLYDALKNVRMKYPRILLDLGMFLMAAGGIFFVAVVALELLPADYLSFPLALFMSGVIIVAIDIEYSILDVGNASNNDE